jgi:glucose-6-phosphate-specific signal transduction histidine kinase
MPDTVIHENTIWIYLIITSSIVVILTAVFSLTHGINEIFPFFFLIPVLLVACYFPKQGVMVTITLGMIYIVLVWIFGTYSIPVIAFHTAWFFIFVPLGIALTHFAERSRINEIETQRLRNEAFQRIEKNMEEFEVLNDQIRNPLQAIMLETDMVDERTKDYISAQVKIMEKILDKLDEGYIESKKVRKFLQNYYGFGKN